MIAASCHIHWMGTGLEFKIEMFVVFAMCMLTLADGVWWRWFLAEIPDSSIAFLLLLLDSKIIDQLQGVLFARSVAAKKLEEPLAPSRICPSCYMDRSLLHDMLCSPCLIMHGDMIPV